MTCLRWLITSRLVMIPGSLLVALTACSSGSSGPSATPPPAVDLTVTAEGNAFTSNTITIAGGEPTTVFFENLDGQPHNIAIYVDDSASDSLFVGDVITQGTITYEIPALERGEYFFRCDLHPAMTGTVVVEG